MVNKKFGLSLVLLICGCLMGVFFFKEFPVTQTHGEQRNITDIESFYNADGEIIQALEQMKHSQDKAAVITHSNNGQRHIALTFDGLTDRTIIQQILGLLKKYNAKATFFVDGVQAAEDPQTVVTIRAEGQKIENYTLIGMVKMENLSVERMVNDFCRAQKIIKVTTDQGPNLLKCNDTKYTERLLQAAKACGFDRVVKSDIFFNVKQINTLSTADNFVSTIRPGSIVSIKLKINVEPVVDTQVKTDLKPAIDKQPGLKILQEQMDLGEKEIVDGVEKLLIALKKSNYTTCYVEELAANRITSKSGKIAFLQKATKEVKVNENSSFIVKIASLLQEQVIELFAYRTAYAAESMERRETEIKMISTTEPALAYTFGGLSNNVVVEDVLERLKHLGIKATFFVTETEIKKYPVTLERVIENGHEIGIAIRPKDGETLEETRNHIINCRNRLAEQFGVTTNLVKQPWGSISDITKEAVSTLECKLLGQSINVVQSKHKDYTSADQVMSEIFGKLTFSLARGQIIHFRMDYYTNERLVGDLIEKIKEKKVDNIAYVTFYDNPASNPQNDSQYMIKPIGQILNNTQFIYKYPADPKNILKYQRERGHDLAVDEHNFLFEASKRYIGNEDVTYEEHMIGFSKMDARRLDKSGLINTENPVIFLTFDDWGSDAAVNKILYVLRKHNVLGTFFVLTNHVLNNPNLLRTIALQGHDIASHSDQHKPMAVRDSKTGKQVKVQEREEYVKELATSYQTLRDITGNVIVNDKPVLTRFFRPPTLAISRMGFESLFATGYEYIINGSCNTADYAAQNVSQLIRTLEDGLYTKNGEVKKGAILIMHMLDRASYTPLALDILLTANEVKADSDSSKFRVGRLSDYLTGDYSQINRKKTLHAND